MGISWGRSMDIHASLGSTSQVTTRSGGVSLGAWYAILEIDRIYDYICRSIVEINKRIYLILLVIHFLTSRL